MSVKLDQAGRNSDVVPRPPLSVRSDPDRLASFEALHDGVPTWMLEGVKTWVSDILGRVTLSDRAERVLWLEQCLRIRLKRSGVTDRGREPLGIYDLFNRMNEEGFALDVLDLCLGADWCFEGQARRLDDILERSGSLWMVGIDKDDRYCLLKRVDPIAQSAATAEMRADGNAAMHLRSAWASAYGRNPNPTVAYSEAVKAIEAAAKPTISPRDAAATLGKMNRSIRDGPTKWTVALGEIATIETLMSTVWDNQRDRHGTDTDASRDITQAEAEVAVHFAILLVHLFRTGTISEANDRND